jgi:uncharacterized membrane protein
VTGAAHALAVVGAVGAAVVGGVFLVFSVAVMPAFARLAPGHGVAVMQAVNVTIVRSPFPVVFLGTALACVARVVLAPGDPAAWTGAALYVLGGFGVTVGANVPLNDRLVGVDPAAPGEFWDRYARRWTAWNHVRTGACVGAAVILSL